MLYVMRRCHRTGTAAGIGFAGFLGDGSMVLCTLKGLTWKIDTTCSKCRTVHFTTRRHIPQLVKICVSEFGLQECILLGFAH